MLMPADFEAVDQREFLNCVVPIQDESAEHCRSNVRVDWIQPPEPKRAVRTDDVKHRNRENDSIALDESFTELDDDENCNQRKEDVEDLEAQEDIVFEEEADQTW